MAEPGSDGAIDREARLAAARKKFEEARKKLKKPALPIPHHGSNDSLADTDTSTKAKLAENYQLHLTIEQQAAIIDKLKEENTDLKLTNMDLKEQIKTLEQNIANIKAGKPEEALLLRSKLDDLLDDDLLDDDDLNDTTYGHATGTPIGSTSRSEVLRLFSSHLEADQKDFEDFDKKIDAGLLNIVLSIVGQVSTEAPEEVGERGDKAVEAEKPEVGAGPEIDELDLGPVEDLEDHHLEDLEDLEDLNEEPLAKEEPQEPEVIDSGLSENKEAISEESKEDSSKVDGLDDVLEIPSKKDVPLDSGLEDFESSPIKSNAEEEREADDGATQEKADEAEVNGFEERSLEGASEGQVLQEKLEEERAQQEEAEKEAEADAEKEKLEQERLEQERLEQEAAERQKAEEEEQTRLEEERLEKEKLEQEAAERQKAEEEAEQNRLEQERLEKEELEKKEQERVEAERVEQERIEAEKAEQEKLKKEEDECREKERLEQERIEQEKAEKERLEQEEKAQAEKQRLKEEKAAEEKAEQQRLADEKAEQERVEKEKAEVERIEKEKADQERAQQEAAEKEKAEQERDQQEAAEKERLEQEEQTKAREAKLDAALSEDLEEIQLQPLEPESKPKVDEVPISSEQEAPSKDELDLNAEIEDSPAKTEAKANADDKFDNVDLGPLHDEEVPLDNADVKSSEKPDDSLFDFSEFQPDDASLSQIADFPNEYATEEQRAIAMFSTESADFKERLMMWKNWQVDMTSWTTLGIPPKVAL